jgi:hypothetical protein
MLFNPIDAKPFSSQVKGKVWRASIRVSKNFVTNTSHVLSLQYQRMNIAQPSLKMEKIKGNSAHIKAKRVDGVGYTNFKNI